MEGNVMEENNKWIECPKCKRWVPVGYKCPWCEPSTHSNLFEFMLGLQGGFQAKYGWVKKPLYPWAAAMMAEAGELWGGCGGKWWKKKQNTPDENLEELIDLWHFFMGFMLDAEITPEQFFEAYLKKLRINYERQESGIY
jgi:hypothetical protein